ncbi:hypothetical protein FO519_000357 [Halicephalobus sp. NKZ332]|nr:hypothetical protein FO519_000357 [Halicephalobus sp. NKZ332]
MLADYSKINLEPYVVDATIIEWGGFENDTWTGMMELLNEGTVDVMNDVMQYTEQRAQNFDYSYPIYNLQIVYITRKKRHDLSFYMWDIISPFTIKIWVTLIASFLVLTGLAVLIQYVEWRLGLLKSFDWTEKIGQYVRTALHQSDQPIHSPTLANKIEFIVFGLLLATMFPHLYEAFLLSPLLLQIENKPFKDFDELLSLIYSGVYHVVVDQQNYDYYWYYEYLRTSNDSHFIKLRNALRGNPLHIVENISVALDVVEGGNYVYPTQQDQPEMVEARLRCDLMFMDVGKS